MFDFEKFSVYQKAEAIYAKVLKLLENKEINKTMKDQFRRATISIALNIAEGSGKFTKNDKKNFYIMARASVYECVAIIRMLKMEKNMSEETFDQFYSDFEEIAKMLSALINTMLKRK